MAGRDAGGAGRECLLDPVLRDLRVRGAGVPHQDGVCQSVCRSPVCGGAEGGRCACAVPSGAEGPARAAQQGPGGEADKYRRLFEECIQQQHAVKSSFNIRRPFNLL